jgi:hypothetical protein
MEAHIKVALKCVLKAYMLAYRHSSFSVDTSARIYQVFPLLCPICGGQMRIIAFITHSANS